MSPNNSSDNKSGETNGMEYHSSDEDDDDFWADQPDDVTCVIMFKRPPQAVRDALAETAAGGIQLSNELRMCEMHARGMDARGLADALQQALNSVKAEARQELRQELAERMPDELRNLLNLSNDVLKGRRDN